MLSGSSAKKIYSNFYGVKPGAEFRKFRISNFFAGKARSPAADLSKVIYIFVFTYSYYFIKKASGIKNNNIDIFKIKILIQI